MRGKEWTNKRDQDTRRRKKGRLRKEQKYEEPKTGTDLTNHKDREVPRDSTFMVEGGTKQDGQGTTTRPVPMALKRRQPEEEMSDMALLPRHPEFGLTDPEANLTKIILLST